MKNVIFLLFILFACYQVGAQNDLQKTDTLCVTQFPPVDTVENLPPPVRFAEEMPEFIGGMEKMYEFLQSKLTYPESARISNISGIVLVEFVVERDGSVTNVKVILPLYPECDKEVVKVVQMMPKWKPGKSMGEPVRCFFHIPIHISPM